MRILFDQSTPLPLRSWLAAHEIETACERGWSEFSNGDLLAAAETANFDLFITTDHNLRYQQNLDRHRLVILVLMVGNWPALEHQAEAIATAVETIQPGQYVEWSPP